MAFINTSRNAKSSSSRTLSGTSRRIAAMNPVSRSAVMRLHVTRSEIHSGRAAITWIPSCQSTASAAPRIMSAISVIVNGATRQPKTWARRAAMTSGAVAEGARKIAFKPGRTRRDSWSRAKILVDMGTAARHHDVERPFSQPLEGIEGAVGRFHFVGKNGRLRDPGAIVVNHQDTFHRIQRHHHKLQASCHQSVRTLKEYAAGACKS